LVFIIFDVELILLFPVLTGVGVSSRSTRLFRLLLTLIALTGGLV
jgi:NADH:ubiquinone oxidoreductase subunit 3 (subunit A)